MKKFIAFFLLASISGCTVFSPKIKCIGVDEDACQASILKVKQSVSKNQKKAFEDAIAIVGFSNLQLDINNPDRAKREMAENIDGLGSSEIFKKAKSICEERLSDLMKQKKAYVEAEDKIKLFEVVESKFYFQKDMFSDNPIADIKVKNNTGETISQIAFDARLETEGRDVPWLKDHNSYEIPGGLKDKESAHWKLDLNQFSDWGKVENRKDYKLVLKITELLGVDKKPLWNASFDEEKEQQVKDLQSKIEQFH